jgi:hypothetical protein
MKVLAIVGVRTNKIMERKDLTLTHKDVEVLGLAPCETSNGIFVHNAFMEACEKIKKPFKAIVIDRGSDIKCGAKHFQRVYPETKIIHDISHKLSNVLEKILKDNPSWIAYNQELTLTRHRVQQTEFAALMPPKQRRDARFMDISGAVLWPQRMWEIEKNGKLGDVSKDRFEEYLGWMKKYKNNLFEWEWIVSSGEMIKEIIRQNWLSKEIYEYIEGIFKEFKIKQKLVKLFVKEALQTVLEEVEKLDEGEKMLASTEVLESIFGKYKAINVGSEQGISGNVLGICTFIGPELTETQILVNMEKTPTKTMFYWVKEKLGNSVGSIRKKFFQRTKFDENITGEE